MKPTLFMVVVLSLLSRHSFGQEIIQTTPVKKLIDFGWNSPFSSEWRSNPEKFESSPFDGITIKLPKSVGAGNIFMVNDLRKVSTDSLLIERNLNKTGPSSKILTDNFLAIYGASQMDWFSDTDWAIVEKQLRYAAQQAKLLGCIGLLWDPEPYKPGKNPWKYDEQKDIEKLSFNDYYNQIRKRGAQFITILQEEFPGLVILSLREFSDFQKGSPFSETLLPVQDMKETKEKLKTAWFGLHIPFTIGILDAILPETKFIDCNEDAYYYTSAFEFYQIRNILKNDGRSLVPEQLHQKFAAQYSIGCAISQDYVTGNWANIISFPYRLSGQAKMLTTKEQALWFEHNAYYALRTSDEYAWLYTETANWWTGQNVPEGFQEALISAKKKVSMGEPLGFSVEEMLNIAREKAEKANP